MHICIQYKSIDNEVSAVINTDTRPVLIQRHEFKTNRRYRAGRIALPQPHLNTPRGVGSIHAGTTATSCPSTQPLCAYSTRPFVSLYSYGCPVPPQTDVASLPAQPGKNGIRHLVLASLLQSSTRMSPMAPFCQGCHAGPCQEGRLWIDTKRGAGGGWVAG